MTTSQAIRRWTGENIGYIGFALAVLVAGIHLFHPQRGFPRLVVLVTTGNTSLLVSDPRPVAFVLSALAILLGIQLAVADVARKPVYALGMALMVTYISGYFAWHLSGHGGFLPGREPLYHGLHPVAAVVSHLVSSPLVALAILAETALFGVLVTLYRTEP